MEQQQQRRQQLLLMGWAGLDHLAGRQRLLVVLVWQQQSTRA
jgi:hypothetical protein